MRFYLLALLIGTIVLSGIFFDYFGLIFNLFRNHHEALSSVVEESFFISITVFTVVYFFSTAFSFPLGTVLTLIGGHLFNVFYGFFAVVTGATLGALALFLFVRSGSMKMSNRICEKSEMFLRLKKGIEKDIWGYLFFVRFFPVFPFWFVNIASALLGLRVFPYLISTFFGIMPATLCMTILGAGIDDILEDHLRNNWNLFAHTGFIFGLCALGFLAILPAIYRNFRN